MTKETQQVMPPYLGQEKTTGGSTVGVETERKSPWQKRRMKRKHRELSHRPWVPVFCEFRFVKMLKGLFLDLAVDRKQGDHCMERANSGEEGAACQGKVRTPLQAQTTDRERCSRQVWDSSQQERQGPTTTQQ